MTRQHFTLHVKPQLPERIARLNDLASNLWFSWHRPTRHLFELLDWDLWWSTGRNPRVFLRCIDQSLLEMAAGNDTFLSAYRRALAEHDSYLEERTSGYLPAGLAPDDLIAYFCAEFGYHESFPIYSGGLGILAGDHCKTASDLGLPFIAVGLLYRQGYFNQQINENGQQIAGYSFIQAEDAPVRPVRDAAGNEVIVHCDLEGRPVAVKVWQADVGRIPVLLLDTDLPENEPDDRQITRQLYGGDSQTRLRQEIILGIAGVRALRAAGFSPRVWHINEGHAAFQIVERIRELVSGGLEFDAAIEAVAACTVFTTHTPVAAGHDVFDREVLLGYFRKLIAELGIGEEGFLDLGTDSGAHSGFNMTRLALTGARHVNGVSRIHRHATAEICASNWPEISAAENPIGFVTNGVHVPTFMQTEWVDLLEQNIGSSWRYQLMDRELFRQIDDIPDGRFWYVGQRVKAAMLTGLRERLYRQHSRNKLSEAHIHRLLKYLDPERPDVLTIGFGRRFATYKRATLLLHNLAWLKDIVDTDDRPVVFVFAGKAHPADHPAQQLIQELHRVSNLPEFFGKLLVVEGYDMGLGRLLTSGVDVWLNTPVHPMEASGTSGMKAAINGTVNVSVLDGWWAEAYDGENGWAIPPSLHSSDPVERDRHDARTLYEILQDEVIPLYYARDERLGYSPGWVRKCKRSMSTILPHFNMNRAVHDYAVLFYGPAAKRGRQLEADGFAAARGLAAWKLKARVSWPGVELRLASTVGSRIDFSTSVTLAVDVTLNGLVPGDIRLECVVSRKLCSSLTVPVRQFAERAAAESGLRTVGYEHVYVQIFEATGQPTDGVQRYKVELQPPWCGELRYEVRASPWHPGLSHPYELGLMRWI
ncbi:MAG: alpha-glucan family phosphorylase [Chromatiales bacterium]|nr:MAG: alpha-glucan family phosphorylase [Chromatiales bacterium]